MSGHTCCRRASCPSSELSLRLFSSLMLFRTERPLPLPAAPPDIVYTHTTHTQDTLSFVDVRSIAYNKNPDNTHEIQVNPAQNMHRQGVCCWLHPSHQTLVP
jgi:hypothetical protein